MIKEVIEIDVRTKEGKAQLKELQSGVKDVGTTSKEASKEVNALGGVADKATGGAISGFKALKGTVTGAIKQFGVLRLAVAATGIGALVLAITAVGKAFTSSEEGQNKFAKIMGVIGAITGNLVDLLADLGEKLISVFENPKQALKDFGNLIKDNIQTRFEGLTELIPQLGKAINLLFKGQFSEAGKVAGNAVAKVALGVDDLSGKIQESIDKTKEFIEENIRESKIAAQIADQRAEADKQERALLTERAEANRRIAELRELAADKENVSVEERIAALQEAGRINEEITQKEIETARLRFEAKKAENALAKSTKEDLDEQAQLEARLIELETARLQRQKSLTAEVTTARREAIAEQKALEAAAAAEEKEKEAEKEAKEKERKAKEVEESKKELDEKKRIAAEEIALEQQVTQAKSQALDAIVGLTNKESSIGKAAFIAKQILAAKEMVATAKDTLGRITLKSSEAAVATATGAAETAKIGFPQNIPMIAGAIGQGAMIVSMLSGLKEPQGYATGGLFTGDGHVRGAGTSTSDSINAKLSDYEFVTKASSVKKIGIENMEYMNRTGELPLQRAYGGLVTPQDTYRVGMGTVDAINRNSDVQAERQAQASAKSQQSSSNGMQGLTIINQIEQDDLVGNYMRGSAGGQIILNQIKASPSEFKRALGVS